MDITTQMDQWVMVLNAVKGVNECPEQFKLKQDFSKTLVQELLVQAAEYFSLDASAVYFMCWGRILDQKNSLESYGIKNGSLMILRQKANTRLDSTGDSNETTATSKASEKSSSASPPTALSQGLDKAFHYRKELKYFNKHSFPFARCLKTDETLRDKFINEFPELSQDPSLFAVFTEISTISALLDGKYLESTLKRYPTFLQVTHHFIELWRDETSKNPNANAELNNLFILTDDEEETEGQQQQQQQQHVLQQQQIMQQNSSSARLRAQQLANLQGIARDMLERSASSQQQHSPRDSSGSDITPEMLRNALQSSMPNPTSECAPLSSTSEPITESTTPSTTSSTSSSSRAPTLAEQLSRASSAPQTPSASQNSERSAQVQTLIDRLPQLQALRELGITDEIVAIQALEAANGDLEVAINIIFSEDN